MSNLQIIPIMMCFDDNYTIPAAVAMYSILSNASKAYKYEMYVLHSDISDTHQKKLIDNIKSFSNATLHFIDMKNHFSDLFSKTTSKGHFTKEMFYKFLPAKIFPQYEKIIITDVDVVFTGDISTVYTEFDIKQGDYLSACIQVCHKNKYEKAMRAYLKVWTKEEFDICMFAGGFYVFNLQKMRTDNIVEKFITFAQNNTNKLLAPEQDCISLVCHPKIHKMKPNALVSTVIYEQFKNKDYENSILYDKEQVINALQNPVQLHYAGGIKPWNNPNITKADIWYEYLVKTNFYHEQIKRLILQPKHSIRIFKIQNKILRKKITCVINVENST